MLHWQAGVVLQAGIWQWQYCSVQQPWNKVCDFKRAAAQNCVGRLQLQGLWSSHDQRPLFKVSPRWRLTMDVFGSYHSRVACSCM
jgi:hypothetical protein